LALMSSSARRMPSSALEPNVAVSPLRDATWPMTMSPLPPDPPPPPEPALSLRLQLKLVTVATIRQRQNPTANRVLKGMRKSPKRGAIATGQTVTEPRQIVQEMGDVSSGRIGRGQTTR